MIPAVKSVRASRVTCDTTRAAVARCGRPVSPFGNLFVSNDLGDVCGPIRGAQQGRHGFMICNGRRNGDLARIPVLDGARCLLIPSYACLLSRICG